MTWAATRVIPTAISMVGDQRRFDRGRTFRGRAQDVNILARPGMVPFIPLSGAGAGAPIAGYAVPAVPADTHLGRAKPAQASADFVVI